MGDEWRGANISRCSPYLYPPTTIATSSNPPNIFCPSPLVPHCSTSLLPRVPYPPTSNISHPSTPSLLVQLHVCGKYEMTFLDSAFAADMSRCQSCSVASNLVDSLGRLDDTAHSVQCDPALAPVVCPPGQGIVTTDESISCNVCPDGYCELPDSSPPLSVRVRVSTVSDLQQLHLNPDTNVCRLRHQ